MIYLRCTKPNDYHCNIANLFVLPPWTVYQGTMCLSLGFYKCYNYSILLFMLQLSTNVIIATTKMMQYIVRLIWCGPNCASSTHVNDFTIIEWQLEKVPWNTCYYKTRHGIGLLVNTTHWFHCHINIDICEAITLSKCWVGSSHWMRSSGP